MENKSYRHLAEADRIRIETWLGEGRSQAYIAKKLGRSRSTVSREINNRGAPNCYVGRFAQVDYEEKREMCRPKKKVEETSIGPYVIKKIRAGWSPETIAGRIKLEIRQGLRPAGDCVCSEAIYKFVYE